MTVKPALIVNPNSSGGQTRSRFAQFLPTIEKMLGPVDVFWTERPRHATELAKIEATKERNILIAVGGDGTIHEVANGILEAQNPYCKLGIIGQGTGGDFRKSLGIEHTIESYCRVIASQKTRSIDVGHYRCNDTQGHPVSGYFVNILSMGIPGLVDHHVGRMGRALGGQGTYFAASIRALLECPIADLKVTGHLYGKAFEKQIQSRTIAVCNGKFFGSGMMIGPMAVLDDGIFDVVDLGNANMIKFAAVNAKMYEGTHIAHPEVSHFQCQSISFQLADPSIAPHYLLDIDGEVGQLPVQIELVPNALTVFSN